MDFNEYQAQVLTTESNDFVAIEERLQSLGRERIDALLWKVQLLAQLLDHTKRAIFYGAEESMRLVMNKLLIGTDAQTEPRSPPIPMLTTERILRLFHALLGIGSEAGEIAAPIKIFMMDTTGVQSAVSKLDVVNVSEEGGDVQWYLTLLQDSIGMSLESAATHNIAKLRERYPDKFNEYDAQHEHRDLDAERVELEQPSGVILVPPPGQQLIRVACKRCNGQGQIKISLTDEDIADDPQQTREKECPECKGARVRIVTRDIKVPEVPVIPPLPTMEECPACNGVTKIFKAVIKKHVQCPRCGGLGKTLVMPDLVDNEPADVPPIIPAYPDNPTGLHQHYQIMRPEGHGSKPFDPRACYFVLRTDGWSGNPAHVLACRAALAKYAMMMRPYNDQLSDDINRHLNAHERLGPVVRWPNVEGQEQAETTNEQ